MGSGRWGMDFPGAAHLELLVGAFGDEIVDKRVEAGPLLAVREGRASGLPIDRQVHALDGDPQPVRPPLLSRRQVGFCSMGPENRTISVGTTNHSHVRP